MGGGNIKNVYSDKPQASLGSTDWGKLKKLSEGDWLPSSGYFFAKSLIGAYGAYDSLYGALDDSLILYSMSFRQDIPYNTITQALRSASDYTKSPLPQNNTTYSRIIAALSNIEKQVAFDSDLLLLHKVKDLLRSKLTSTAPKLVSSVPATVDEDAVQKFSTYTLLDNYFLPPRLLNAYKSLKASPEYVDYVNYRRAQLPDLDTLDRGISLELFSRENHLDIPHPQTTSGLVYFQGLHKNLTAKLMGISTPYLKL